jgi:dTDP-4-dehydrorhamnose 3,5-epimerase
VNSVGQLKFIPQSLSGVQIIESFHHADARGEFVKTFLAAEAAERGIQFELREEFFSVSRRGALRGMHFQTPPYAHQKIVTCLAGSVIDVLVDLRKSSPTYGEHLAVELSAANRRALYIPVGLAHGFLSLCDNSCVIYKTDREYAPDQDAGIRWDRFGYTWPLETQDLLISPRDQRHPPLGEFASPF